MGTASVTLTPDQASRITSAMSLDVSGQRRLSWTQRLIAEEVELYGHFNRCCADIAQEIGFKPTRPGKWSVRVDVDPSCASQLTVLIFTESP